MANAPRGLRSIVISLALLWLVTLWPASAAAGAPLVWEHIAGPSGSTTWALAVDPHDPRTVFAGTPHGLYKSTDSGATWVRLEKDALRCQEIRQIAISPISPEVIYVGGREGLFRTTDAGASWVQLGEGLENDVVLSLAIQPAQAETVYLGTEKGAFKSDDHGDHWQPLGQALPEGPIWPLICHPSQPGTLYAGTDEGLYTSTDGGASWQRADNRLPAGERVSALSISPYEPFTLYAGTVQGLFSSRDGGAHWIPSSMAGGQDLSVEPYPVSVLSFDHTQESALYANPEMNVIARSMDGGASWHELYAFEGGEQILSIAASPGGPQYLYVGTSRGLYRSGDGGLTWAASVQGLRDGDARLLLDVPGAKRQFYLATPWNLYQTQDGGASWSDRGQSLPIRPVLALALDPDDPQQLYAGISLDELYRSADGGIHWQPVRDAAVAGTALMQSVQDVPLVELIAFRLAEGKDTPLTLYALTESAGVWRSNDAGQSWEPLNVGLPELPIEVIVLAPGKPPRLYAGVGRELYRLDAVPDLIAAPSWQRVNAQPFSGDVIQVVHDPTRTETLFLSTDHGGIYRSTDGGHDWLNLAEGVLSPDQRVDGLVVVPRRSRPPLLCALIGGSLLYSQDDGITWSHMSGECFEGAILHGLDLDEDAPGTIYLGTSKGIYRGRESITSRATWVHYALFIVLCSALLAAGTYAYLRRCRGNSRPQRDLLEQNWDSWDRIMVEALAAHERITPEMLTSIPAEVRLMAMRRYMDRHQDQNLIFREEPVSLEPANRAPLQLLADHWASLVNALGDVAAARPIATVLTEQLCELLGFVPLESRVFRSLLGYMITAPAFRLSIPPNFPIILTLKHGLSPEDIRDARDLMSVLNVTSFFALLVVVDDELGRRERAKELRKMVHDGADDFIVLDYQDLRSLFLAADAEHRLIEMILEQVDLTVVSPYVISGPVPAHMFFGRDYELKAIMRTIQDRSYAIVGGRKIGKTSVLSKVQRLMEQTSGFQPYYLDCQHVTHYEEFFGALAVKCQVQVEAAVPDVLRRIVLRLQRQNGPGVIVLLLDEVDKLLEFDIRQQTRLFRMFRTLSQEGLCRFVFCGERQLDGALHDPDSPLFNFASTMRLSYLSVRDALRVVQEPMATMGVLFEDREALPAKIVELSSCHPNIIQAICQMLIVRTNARNDRMIRWSDLHEVRVSDEFREFFLEVTWGNATTLERLISVLMAGKPIFTLSEVKQTLSARGCAMASRAIEAALEGLLLISILQKQGSTYSFAARSFPVVLAESGLAGGLFIDGLLETLQLEECSSSAIPSQK